MKDMFLSEWRRFRRPTLIVALAHSLVLLFLSRLTNVLQLGYEDQGMMLAIYMALGLTLAIVQIGSYRKPGRWMWLIHRPLSPTRIFSALALSALAMLTATVLAPLLTFVLATDHLTNQVVDSRHYVVLLHTMAFTMMAWLAGALACVSRHKATVAVLIAPMLLAMHMASVWALLLPVLACLAWLTWIAMHGFRADREAPIARSSVLVLTAIPLQLGFFLLVFQMSKFTFEAADLVRSSYPSKTVLGTDKDVEAQMRSMSQNFVIEGLKHSNDPRATSWREQLPLLDVADITPDIERYPVRNQISNLGARWLDEKRRIEWTFSHDRMMFHGRDPKSGTDHGWWGAMGAGSTQAFHQIPDVLGISPNRLYAIDDDTQRQYELARLPEGEWFVSRPVRALDRMLLLTNKRVLAYRSDWRTASPHSPPQLDWQLATAEGEAVPPMVNVVELLDGWLVSLFYYPGQEFDGFESLASPRQQVLHIGADRVATLVAERSVSGVNIVMGSSIAVPKASWWLSPLLYAVGRGPESLIDKGLTHPTELAPLPAIRAFYPVAGTLMLISLALGYWWLHGAPVSPTRRRLWLASCALLSLPAFLSLICLEPRARR